MLEKLPDAIGHAISGVRAGLDSIAFNQLNLRQGTNAIRIESLAFADHAPIPQRYTADGDGISPPLQWWDVPQAAAALVLLVEDADSPTPHPLVHAIVVGLPAEEDGALAEGALNSTDTEDEDVGPELHIGLNSFLKTAWLPPDPPPGHGVHRYAFQLFALDAEPDFSNAPGRDEVLGAVAKHAIASGLLIGTCERDNRIKVDEPKPAVAGPLTPG
ncbi:MAG: YbhB/YbcL family Raf kinase inhibitor-like protein [Burkholderiales bacterium]